MCCESSVKFVRGFYKVKSGVVLVYNCCLKLNRYIAYNIEYHTIGGKSKYEAVLSIDLPQNNSKTGAGYENSNRMQFKVATYM